MPLLLALVSAGLSVFVFFPSSLTFLSPLLAMLWQGNHTSLQTLVPQDRLLFVALIDFLGGSFDTSCLLFVTVTFSLSLSSLGVGCCMPLSIVCLFGDTVKNVVIGGLPYIPLKLAEIVVAIPLARCLTPPPNLSFSFLSLWLLLFNCHFDVMC